MKCFLLTIATVTCLILMGACQQNQGYKVTGTVKGAQDGDTVKLIEMRGWDAITLQETVIKNGEFTFTGRQDTADFRYLTRVKDGAFSAGVQFILENGEIHVAMNPDTYTYDIKGTPTNEKWCAFFNEDEALCEKSLELYRALNDTVHPLDSLIAQQKQTEMEAIDKETVAKRLQFSKDNIKNAAGVYCLLSNLKNFDEETVSQLINEVPEIYQTEDVNTIKEAMANKKKTAVGQPFIDFTLKTPEGKELSVSEIVKANKVVMIDFWASWCGPCRAEMPTVKAAYEKYHTKGLEIIGVSLDNGADDWKKAIASMGLKWPQISDLKGWKCEGAEQYGVKSIPATFLIQDGKIIARNLRGEDLENKLKEILK